MNELQNISKEYFQIRFSGQALARYFLNRISGYTAENSEGDINSDSDKISYQWRLFLSTCVDFSFMRHRRMIRIIQQNIKFMEELNVSALLTNLTVVVEDCRRPQLTHMSF